MYRELMSNIAGELAVARSSPRALFVLARLVLDLVSALQVERP